MGRVLRASHCPRVGTTPALADQGSKNACASWPPQRRRLVFRRGARCLAGV